MGGNYEEIDSIPALLSCANIFVFLSSKIVTLSPKDQAKRFCQGVRPLLNE